MLLRYLFDPNLAQASYLVGCQRTGEALVIDPNREIDQYLDLASREGLRITAVTETHIHADYVSGSKELAERAGATLYLSDEGGPDWSYRFPHNGLRNGNRFMVGNVRIEAIHTPGHTPEHLSFLLTDTAGADEPMGLFSGDFIFVGDIGRPDLLESAAGVANSREPAARTLFKTLQKARDLPDYLQMWPGHGAGSACGKALGAVPTTTLGYERRFNWAFQVRDEREFVERVLEGQPEPPKYFAQMKRINRDGPPRRADLPPPAWLTEAKAQALLDERVMMVDTRPWHAYVSGHLPGTISIPLNSGFANWAGTLLPYDQPLYFMVEPLLEQDLLDELTRIGLDNVGGLLAPDLLSQWDGSLEQTPQAALDEFTARLERGEIYALDVRRSAEYQETSIPGVVNLPLQWLPDRYETLPTDKPLYIHCQSGTRSALAASYLRARTGAEVVNVPDGMQGWQKARLDVGGEKAYST